MAMKTSEETFIEDIVRSITDPLNDRIYELEQKLLETTKPVNVDLGDVIECECGGNERVALDCTMKPCKHPKYYKG